MHWLRALKSGLERFRKEEDGVVTVEFVIIFPTFFLFFLMTYENGMISLQHVMLERGVDLAVRNVRIGRLANPDANDLRAEICDFANIIPDCENQLRIEMLRRDVRNWAPVNGPIQCVNREAGAQADQDDEDFDAFGNNELMYLRVCARIDPVLPTTGLIGRRITESNSGLAAGGSYALVSSAAFVVEPFQGSP
jgi:hypothetical protein